jgi:hypothetical protein
MLDVENTILCEYMLDLRRTPTRSKPCFGDARSGVPARGDDVASREVHLAAVIDEFDRKTEEEFAKEHAKPLVRNAGAL